MILNYLLSQSVCMIMQLLSSKRSTNILIGLILKPQEICLMVFVQITMALLGTRLYYILVLVVFCNY